MNFLDDDSSVFTRARLPRRPYCTDELASGCWHEPQARALDRRYIQINPPRTALWLAFDVDRPAGGLAWQSANLPPPAWSTTTRHNGHGHLVYGLEIPVIENDFGSKSARYLAAIREGFRVRLNADPGFAGLLTKNPIHPDWVVERGLQKLWFLQELAEYVELPKKSASRGQFVGGRGRNVDTFDRLRFWAYQTVSAVRPAGFEAWQLTVRGQVDQLNQHNTPSLGPRELDHIATSVSRWVWTRYVGQGGAFNLAASERGKLGGRPKTTTKAGQPWVLAGIDRSTWYRHQASVRQT